MGCVGPFCSEVTLVSELAFACSLTFAAALVRALDFAAIFV